jgi:hypothetical protein
VTTSEWVAVVGIIITLMAATYGGVRFMVRAIMAELTPNGGSSLRDQVNRIEARLDALYERLIR